MQIIELGKGVELQIIELGKGVECRLLSQVKVQNVEY